MVKEGRIFRVDYGLIRDVETDEIAGIVKTLKASGLIIKSEFEYNDLMYDNNFIERNETEMFGVFVTQDIEKAEKAFSEFDLTEVLKASW